MITMTIFFLIAMMAPIRSMGAAYNDRPIIGILTQPQGGEEGGAIVESGNVSSSYIAASYVKWAESAGARVVPLHYDATDEELTNMFRHINGILFPGGGTSLKNVSTNRFYAAASLLYSLANEENKRHPWSFPIQGTCLGFQLLSVLAAGDEVLCGGCFEGTDGDPLPLTFTSDLSRSWLFESMTKTLVDKLRVENLTENSHSSGVEPSAFAKSEKLAEMYTVLSVNFDENGREFVSTFEGKKLPYSATQWHPEKNNFEFGGVGALGKRAIPHTADAVAVSQYFANNFVNRARRSLQNFSTSEAEASALIYNDAKYLVTDPAGYFDQVYLWPNGWPGHAQEK